MSQPVPLYEASAPAAPLLPFRPALGDLTRGGDDGNIVGDVFRDIVVVAVFYKQIGVFYRMFLPLFDIVFPGAIYTASKRLDRLL